MKLDDLNIVQAAIERRKQQEILRKEYRQKNALQNIKDIFLDAFSINTLDESKDIIDHLSEIVDQVQDENLGTNEKLLEWLEIKFQSKVTKKVATKIALSQVELAKKIEHVIEMLNRILSLYTKLCNTAPFIDEVGQQIVQLEDELRLSSEKLTQDSTHTQQHFQTLLQTQRKIVVLITK